MPRSSTNYITVSNFKRGIWELVQSTVREEVEVESVDKKGQRLIRRRVKYYPQIEYEPPYVMEGVVAAKDYKNLMEYLTDLYLVYDVDVHRANRGQGYRVRAKFRHPDYFLSREELMMRDAESDDEVEVIEEELVPLPSA